MKAVGYLRVSTDGQSGEDTFGIAAQEEKIKSYAKKQGIEISEIYKDEGISGAKLERPGLQKMLIDANGGDFDTVIVAKMDRLARDLYIALFIEKELLLNNVKIISVSEPVNGNDPMHTAFRQMIGVFAELEKSFITARMSGGRKQKARGGGYAGGGAAIGYKAHRGSKALKIDKEKAVTVKRVFELREDQPGLTLQELANMLNTEGFTTAQNKRFLPMQVKRILDRKDFYSGVYIYSGIRADGKHQAIL